VIDDGTTADLRTLAEAAGARVVVRPWQGFPKQRNVGLELATGDWLLFVDADERVTPSLAQEVRQVVATGSDTVGYWIPRRNVIAGEWVRHAGWWPDCQLRLLKRGHAHYDEGRVVHELAILDGPDGTLSEPFLHLNYQTLAEFRSKQRRYAHLEAVALWESGIRPRPHSVILQPLRELRRRMIELGGVRQGVMGARLGVEMALASFWTYRELREMIGQDSPPAKRQPARASGG
jgi:glycosyltransferase involved in cell wall biosynthesis